MEYIEDKKLKYIMDSYGISEIETFVRHFRSGKIPGICMNEGCDIIIDSGTCPNCKTDTVQSFHYLI